MRFLVSIDRAKLEGWHNLSEEPLSKWCESLGCIVIAMLRSKTKMESDFERLKSYGTEVDYHRPQSVVVHGEFHCKVCGRKYSEHPYDGAERNTPLYPIGPHKKLCDGVVVQILEAKP